MVSFTVAICAWRAIGTDSSSNRIWDSQIRTNWKHDVERIVGIWTRQQHASVWRHLSFPQRIEFGDRVQPLVDLTLDSPCWLPLMEWTVCTTNPFLGTLTLIEQWELNLCIPPSWHSLEPLWTINNMDSFEELSWLRYPTRLPPKTFGNNKIESLLPSWTFPRTHQESLSNTFNTWDTLGYLTHTWQVPLPTGSIIFVEDELASSLAMPFGLSSTCLWSSLSVLLTLWQ